MNVRLIGAVLAALGAIWQIVEIWQDDSDED
jgi:hypothetical protein